MKKLVWAVAAGAAMAAGAREIDVAAIMWPSWHAEPRWKELGIFPHGNGEWQNVYEGRPRFAGHYQPYVPYWGYERDDDPQAMARQIDAALAAGVNVFIYDWYWYGGRPFLEGALNNGFLKAPNNERMKFYIMWANHHVTGLWDNQEKDPSMRTLKWSAYVSREEWRGTVAPRLIEYFKKPNYYTIDGKPVFWLYDPDTFFRGLAAPTEDPRKWPKITAEMVALGKAEIDWFRAEVRKAGFPGLHLQYHAYYLLPQIDDYDYPNPNPVRPIPGKERPTVNEFIDWFGIESFCAYNAPLPRRFLHPETRAEHLDYAEYAPYAMRVYDEVAGVLKVPFYPTVSLGWDNNARFPADVTNHVLTNNTPEKVEAFMRLCKRHAEMKTKGAQKLVIINAWNEWTEGEVLQPTTLYGYGYLNACWRVFGE